MNKDKIRCDWANTSEIYQKYHDNKWGIPLHDDQKLFVFVTQLMASKMNQMKINRFFKV